MKKLVTTLLVTLGLSVLMSVTALAATPIKAQGKVTTVQGQAQVVKGVQYVYVGQVAKKLGYDVKFDKETKTLIATKGTTVRTFTFDKDYYTVNGKQFELGYKVGITGNDIILPTSYCGIALDCTVDWFAKSKTMSIIPNTNGKQALIVDRLLASGEYTLKTVDGARTLLPKDTKAKFTISEASTSMSNSVVVREWDATIVTNEADQYTRNAIKEVNKILFPTSYEKVQMYLVTTLRWEVYEHFGETCFFPGVESAINDDRNVYTSSSTLGSVIESIGYQGYKPTIANQEAKRLVTWSPEGLDYFINMWNIKEYTVADYNKVRRAEYELELNNYYEFSTDSNVYYPIAK